MIADLLTVELGGESHVAVARRRAREIAGILGFEHHDCVRVATVVSEIARNAWRHAREGQVEFRLLREGENDILDITVRDKGPGIPDLAGLLDQRNGTPDGRDGGLVSARRLMPRFEINTSEGGTVICFGKSIPRCYIDPIPVVAARVAAALNKLFPPDAATFIEEQDREFRHLLTTLDKSESICTQLNRELEETYRGVASLYAELDDRAQEIHKVVDLKSRFLSNITHEFRTPLNSIISLSRMLLERIDGDLSAEQEKQTRFINRAAHDLSDLVNDLLDLAKADAGKTEITLSPVSVNELFATLRGMLRPLIDNNASVALVFDPPDPPLEITSDERKLSQILRNLISNALKYTLEGEVRVSIHSEGPRLVFCVRDTGIGIPGEHQDKIFEEFYQVQNPLQQKTKGTGLGLALSRRLAVMLGGDITLQSQPGQGSTFWVNLPRSPTAEPASPAQAETHREDAPQLVMFVDGRIETLLAYERMLDRSPYKAVLARDVSEALDMLKRVTVMAIVTSSAESVRNLAASLPPSPAPLPSFIAVGNTPSEAGMPDLIDAYLPDSPQADQLLGCLKKLSPRAPLTALVIDNSQEARQSLRTLLEDFHLDVIEAETAEAAVHLIAERQPALVFTDVILPDYSGTGLVTRLLETFKDGSLVIHSSQVFTNEERDFLRRHATMLIRKGPAVDSVYRTALIHAIAGARRRQSSS